jgi:hypothetical protein
VQLLSSGTISSRKNTVKASLTLAARSFAEPTLPGLISHTPPTSRVADLRRCRQPPRQSPPYPTRHRPAWHICWLSTPGKFGGFLEACRLYVIGWLPPVPVGDPALFS